MKNNTRVFLIGGIIIVAGVIGFNYMQQNKNINQEEKPQNVNTEKKEENKKAPQIKKVGNVDVWTAPLGENIKPGQNFDILMFMNTRGSKIGTFNINLDYNSEFILINTELGNVKSDNGYGLSKGKDTEKYSVMSNTNDISKGTIRFVGIDTIENTMASGEKIHLVTIHAKTTDKFVPGKTTIKLRINELANELGQPLNFKIISGSEK